MNRIIWVSVWYLWYESVLIMFVDMLWLFVKNYDFIFVYLWVFWCLIGGIRLFVFEIRYWFI